ncbi:hypothetical protein G6F32_014615 [Rhizopus arrhizus]|nr:hypothetical protein G6F32_014615 [Rhizopus arrhizus]
MDPKKWRRWWPGWPATTPRSRPPPITRSTVATWRSDALITDGAGRGRAPPGERAVVLPSPPSHAVHATLPEIPGGGDGTHPGCLDPAARRRGDAVWWRARRRARNGQARCRPAHAHADCWRRCADRRPR